MSVEQADNPNPKVFISHAGADKKRFVLDFAKKLRSKGINAWVDAWEILPGDSLVDKIFEEGLKDAQAVIVVISENSVRSEWVREELNAGFVRRVETKCKLIPVIIDECDVPAALDSTCWERIEDLNDYETAFERIVAAVFDHRERPPLGSPPKYTGVSVPIIGDLERIDSIVLKYAGESTLADRHISAAVGVKPLCEKLGPLGISETQVRESIQVLEEGRYIKNGGHWWFHVSHFGMGEYLRVFVSEYREIRQSVCSQIVNHERTRDKEIAEAGGVSLPLVQYIIDDLEARRLVRVSRTNSGYKIYDIAIKLKRAMQG